MGANSNGKITEGGWQKRRFEMTQSLLLDFITSTLFVQMESSLFAGSIMVCSGCSMIKGDILHLTLQSINPHVFLLLLVQNTY